MRAVVIRHPGKGLEAWKMVDLPERSPGPGEVLIRVRAASLNYRDLLIARNLYGPAPRENLVPVSDGAGEVLGVGVGVSGWKPGDRVVGAFRPHWRAGPILPEYALTPGAGDFDGWLAERVLYPAAGLVAIPERLSFEEAATLPCAAVAAWASLFSGARPLKGGESVLVQGTGGVSVLSAQFGRATGIRVIATTSSPAKAARLHDLGVHEVIECGTTGTWSAEVLRRTGGAGVDKVIDVGGANTFEQSLLAVRYGGSINLVGFLGGSDFAVNPMRILSRVLTVEGVSVGSRLHFEEMNRLIARAPIHPVIHDVFPLERATEALSVLERKQHVGKVVVAL